MTAITADMVADTSSDTAQTQPQKRSWKKGLLSFGFNAVAGAVAVAGVRYVASQYLGIDTSINFSDLTSSYTAIAGVLGVGAVGGATASRFTHALKNTWLTINGEQTEKYNWRKQGLRSALTGAIGGFAFAGLTDMAHDQNSILHSMIEKTKTFVSNIFGSPAQAATADLSQIVDKSIGLDRINAPGADLNNLDGIDGLDGKTVDAQNTIDPTPAPAEQYIQGLDAIQHKLSAAARGALTDMQSSNPAIQARGQASLGFLSLHGFGGVPKNAEAALELIRSAAGLGNVNAQVDLEYIKYHGLYGVQADEVGAMGDMHRLVEADKTGRAEKLLVQWMTGNSMDNAAPANVANAPAPAHAPTPAPQIDSLKVNPDMLSADVPDAAGEFLKVSIKDPEALPGLDVSDPANPAMINNPQIANVQIADPKIQKGLRLTGITEGLRHFVLRCFGDSCSNIQIGDKLNIKMNGLADAVLNQHAKAPEIHP